MFRYLPIESELSAPGIGPYCTFGLRVIRVRNGRGEEVICLPDVSTDSSFVQRLADTLNREQLSPIHLPDVLEDLM